MTNRINKIFLMVCFCVFREGRYLTYRFIVAFTEIIYQKSVFCCFASTNPLFLREKYLFKPDGLWTLITNIMDRRVPRLCGILMSCGN